MLSPSECVVRHVESRMTVSPLNEKSFVATEISFSQSVARHRCRRLVGPRRWFSTFSCANRPCLRGGQANTVLFAEFSAEASRYPARPSATSSLPTPAML